MAQPPKPVISDKRERKNFHNVTTINCSIHFSKTKFSAMNMPTELQRKKGLINGDMRDDKLPELVHE